MDNPNKALYNAIENNDVKKVETLLKQEDINPTAEYDEAWWIALRKGNAQINKLLLDWKGPNWPEQGQWIDPRVGRGGTSVNVLPPFCGSYKSIELLELLLDWKSPNGESIDTAKWRPNGELIENAKWPKEAVYTAARYKNEPALALLIKWYIDHKRIIELRELAQQYSEYPLLGTMLQRYENAKAAFMATWKSLEEKGVAKDVRKYIIGKMIKQSMLDPKWDISEKSKRRRLNDNNDNNSMGGSKRKLKRNLNRKKSIRKKSIKKNQLGKNQIKRKKSIEKPIRKNQ